MPRDTRTWCCVLQPQCVWLGQEEKNNEYLQCSDITCVKLLTNSHEKTVFKCESCPIEGKKETQTFVHGVKHFFYLQNVWRKKKKRGIRTGEENSNFLSCLETLSQSNIMSLWLYLPSLWNCCGFVDKLHVTLPADILINTGRNKKKSPVLSSLQGNGLMASMYDEMGEKKQDFFFCWCRNMNVRASAYVPVIVL